MFLKRTIQKIFGKADKKLTAKIESKGLKLIINFLLMIAQDILLIVLDRDKNNLVQIKEYFSVKSVELIANLHQIVAGRIETIQDDKIESFLHHLNDTQKKVFIALTDDEPNNKAQLKQIGHQSFFDLLAVLGEHAKDLIGEDLGDLVKAFIEDVVEENNLTNQHHQD